MINHDKNPGFRGVLFTCYAPSISGALGDGIYHWLSLTVIFLERSRLSGQTLC